jgi:23S rRNA (adenine2030-N6)-methyltransferase
MNYRHIYHAGNFADVVKHCVLLALIDSLKQKPKPFCLLDTHGGLGYYDLSSEATQKTQEYQSGIMQLLGANAEKMPALVKQYLDIIKRYNGDNLLCYPGSPLIAAEALREEDQLIVCELHSDDYQTLKKNLKQFELAHVHHIDAYNGMKAFLPPKQARGFVLIDPPFEKRTEFGDIIAALKTSLKHWRNGTYSIWYPIKDKHKVKQFYGKLTAFNFPLLTIEFTQKNCDEETGLTSFGIVIINPPWKIDEVLKEALAYLAELLNCMWSLKCSEIA